MQDCPHYGKIRITDAMTPCTQDVIQYASQLGRLDLVTLLLTCLGVVIAVFGLVGFNYIKHKAQTIAEETAREIAHEKCERLVNEYIQKEMPQLLQEQREFAQNLVQSNMADLIAGAQEAGTHNDTSTI